MDRAPYVLVSTWRVDAPPSAVWTVFERFVDQPDPFEWWDDLRVRGRRSDLIDVETRSALGYRLRFRLHSLRTFELHVIAFDAVGDLSGSGRVELSEVGGATQVRIDWTVATTRRWMRWTEPVLRPVFAAAHRRVMRRGERALNAWLARP
ncbi:SRPBCC family protein [Aeromicrobium sp. Leaf350]|uniref:SRPBCC family protein n=1 Tax=Aeromicrobium sp. Leaf350 TaxID=2876565 RepID=UPI001E455756|nr:SRPBCC family protein [Aeromicrobium sp. Leaf350]